MGRCISCAQKLSAGGNESIHQWRDVVLSGYIMRQGKRASGGKSIAVHVRFEGALQEGAEDKAVHLIKDDLLVLEDRRPAESRSVEAARTYEICDAERDDGNLLLHVHNLISALRKCSVVQGHGAHRSSDGQDPPRGDWANRTSLSFSDRQRLAANSNLLNRAAIFGWRFRAQTPPCEDAPSSPRQ